MQTVSGRARLARGRSRPCGIRLFSTGGEGSSRGRGSRKEAGMVTVGLLVRFEALPGKEDEVERFLAGALPMVEEEPATTAWFAIRLGPSTFGIFDVFPDESGREAHLSGRVAEALLGSV